MSVSSRFAFVVASVSLALGAFAQVPDVRIRADLRLHYSSQRQTQTLKWYDPLGRHSVISVDFGLEPGFRAYVSQRLQRIPANADNDALDEYYVEDPGLWRVGKQYMPFGRQRIVRESIRGARGDSNLIFENLPISAAVCDNGSGRARGVIARIGGRVGVSFAYGDHYGAQSTSLTNVRRPEDGLGVGRGYRLIVGLDGWKRFGDFTIEAEGAAFRNGETPADEEFEVSDLAVTYAPNRSGMVSIGWGREWRSNTDVFRAEGRYEIYRNLFVEPLVRFKDGSFYDAGFSMRLRL